MSRPLSLLVLLAAPVLLVACENGKSPLLSAKPGECYSVVGRDSAGLPKMAKVPCAGQQAALTCPPPAAAAATCPGVETSGHKASGYKATGRKAVRRSVKRTASTSHYARYEGEVLPRSGLVTRAYEYARVDSDLLGGAAQERSYARSDAHQDYGYREERREEHYAPPPPAPHAYAQSSRKSEQRAYSYEESSSYSARSGSRYSANGASGVDCGCDGPDPRAAGPHRSRDAYGFLTWRGKTPG